MKKMNLIYFFILSIGLILISCKDLVEPDSLSKSKADEKNNKKGDKNSIMASVDYVPAPSKILWSWLDKNQSNPGATWSDQILCYGFRWLACWGGNQADGMPPVSPSFSGDEYTLACSAFSGGITPQIIIGLDGNGWCRNPVVQSKNIYDDQNYAWMDKQISHFSSTNYPYVIGFVVDEPFECVKDIYDANLTVYGDDVPTPQCYSVANTVLQRLISLANLANSQGQKLFITQAKLPSFGLAHNMRNTSNGTFGSWMQSLLNTCSNVEIWYENYGGMYNSPGGPSDWVTGEEALFDIYISFSSYFDTGRAGIFVNCESNSNNQDPDVNTTYNWNNVMGAMNSWNINKIGAGCWTPFPASRLSHFGAAAYNNGFVQVAQ